MNPSIYSIISTVVSFIILLTYYLSVKPAFVMEDTSDKLTKVVSVRICIIYSLLFSSAIGLLVLGISSIVNNYE
jgi:uncharacterized membrane protein